MKNILPSKTDFKNFKYFFNSFNDVEKNKTINTDKKKFIKNI